MADCSTTIAIPTASSSTGDVHAQAEIDSEMIDVPGEVSCMFISMFE